jgi:hypothetical protein
MNLTELEQLEERYKALRQECAQLDCLISQLKAAPEEERDNILIQQKIAEFSQKAREVHHLVDQLISGRQDVNKGGNRGLAGAFAGKQCRPVSAFLNNLWSVTDDHCLVQGLMWGTHQQHHRTPPQHPGSVLLPGHAQPCSCSQVDFSQPVLPDAWRALAVMCIS